MSLDSIVNIQITVQGRAPEQRDVGTPLLFGYHTAWLNARARTYEQADEMLDDGFTADDALYLAARTVKSQNPSPQKFKIGRRVAPLTQLIQLSPTETAEGFEYKGTIGGKSLSYTVLAGATETTVATALAAAINALSAGTTAANGGPASVTGSVAGPWALANGDTLLVAVDADVPGSPDTATFSGTAAARESASDTYDLSGGKTLTVKIDGGSTQTITFVDGNFAVPSAATAAEVAAVINAQIVGASSLVTSTDKVTIKSDTLGTGSHVEVTGGTANVALAFSTSVADGTGNVADLSAVTFDEAKTIIEAATDATVTSDSGKLKLSSSTSGTSSKVLVTSSSTADDEFGFDNATHTGAAAGTALTCTADDPGTTVSFDLEAGLDIKDLTEDTTTDDELAAVSNEDSDWYGLIVVDSQSKATALNAANWTESQRKECVVQTADSETLDPGEDEDVLSALKDGGYARTAGIYHRAIGGSEWLAAGWLAGQLAWQPGSATPAFKLVSGVSVDKLTASQGNAVLAKNGSYYQRVGGLGITYDGKTGSGEFLDTTRFVDWQFFDMQDAVFGALASNPKIPYTDTGVDVLRATIAASLRRGVTAGGLSNDPAPTVTAPRVANVSAQNRINRRLPDVKFEATLAGAIHGIVIRGVIAV